MSTSEEQLGEKTLARNKDDRLARVVVLFALLFLMLVGVQQAFSLRAAYVVWQDLSNSRIDAPKLVIFFFELAKNGSLYFVPALPFALGLVSALVIRRQRIFLGLSLIYILGAAGFLLFCGVGTMSILRELLHAMQ